MNTIDTSLNSNDNNTLNNSDNELKNNIKRIKLVLINKKDLINSNKGSIISIYNNKKIQKIIYDIEKGFNKGYIPVESENGISGSYFLNDINKNPAAIFKPYDEEPFSPNNTKGYSGIVGSNSVRSGILSGELYLREVLAYLLNYNNFYDVPLTFICKLKHNFFKTNYSTISNINKSVDSEIKEGIKYGSMQKFIANNGVACDISYTKFSTLFVYIIIIIN